MFELGRLLAAMGRCPICAARPREVHESYCAVSRTIEGIGELQSELRKAIARADVASAERNHLAEEYGVFRRASLVSRAEELRRRLGMAPKPPEDEGDW